MKDVILRLCFLASLGGLGITLLYPDVLLYRLMHGYSTGHVQYDSTRAPSGLVQHNENDDSDVKKLAFALRFNVLSFGRAGNTTPNMLQTAPLNDGVRIELAPPGTLAMIVGKPDHQFQAFIISTTLTPKSWHTLDVKISPTKLVTAKIDGQLLINTTDPSLQYKISDLVIGGGFSNTRPFDGQLDMSNFSYAFLEPRPYGSVFVTILKVGFALLGLVLLYFLSTPTPQTEEIA